MQSNGINSEKFLRLTLALSVMVMWALAEFADYGYQQYGHTQVDYHDYPKYAYQYGVQDKHTGDFKTAEEHRDGDVTHGSYSFLQPDGVLRTVKYTVTPKEGFKAVVLNSGPGLHHAI